MLEDKFFEHGIYMYNGSGKLQFSIKTNYHNSPEDIIGEKIFVR